jgi:superfamily II DNA/RNA helicase
MAQSIRASEIHSDTSQNKRESTLKQFRDGRISVLVATDIAARGLDVPSISHVVNYDLPLSAADYVHRIGRTGRAGRSGIALSFVSDDQRYLVRDIERVTGRSLDPDSPFSASRYDLKGPRQSRNRQSSGRNGGRGSNGRHGGSGSDARRDRPQSEGRGRPASEARNFGEKQRGVLDATPTQRSEQTTANEGFRRSEQSPRNEGSRTFVAKRPRTSEQSEAFTSNRAKKYLPQSNFWTPRNERNEPTERTERTQRSARTDRNQRDERVVVGSGLTAERPKLKFDRFKKKRAAHVLMAEPKDLQNAKSNPSAENQLDTSQQAASQMVVSQKATNLQALNCRFQTIRQQSGWLQTCQKQGWTRQSV